MLYCGYKTHQTMDVLDPPLDPPAPDFQAAKDLMSSATAKQNAVVFRMLVIQSVVPLILLQFPATITFSGSMFFVLDK